jgi:hypothetical protein
LHIVRFSLSQRHRSNSLKHLGNAEGRKLALYKTNIKREKKVSSKS